MIEIVSNVGLPADETLRIRKNRLKPAGLTGKGKGRVSIVTGIHGDELEGQYVCYELNRILKNQTSELHGIVDIYPAMNPFGIDSVMRGIPGFDLDMNRIFPGNDVCIDIHASNIYLTEVPQIRINEINQKELVPLAKEMNVDFIWVHGNSTVLESTLAHTLNSRGVRTLVVEMGVGMRITKEYCNQLVKGILNLLASLGIYTGITDTVRQPLYSDCPEDVEFLNAPCCGIFVKDREHGSHVEPGERIGRILDPLTGDVLSEVRAENRGILFTVREYPVVQIGSLMGRILKDDREVKQA